MKFPFIRKVCKSSNCNAFFKIFLTITFFSVSTKGEEARELSPKAKRRWESILKIYKQSSTPIPMGLLTDSGSPRAELKASIGVLNSDLGQQFICRFPSRYLAIRSLFKKSLPKNLNINKCELYDAFFKSLNTKHISLLFASEFLNAPSSAFGHVVLAFHDKSDVKPFDNIIHFAATPDSNDPFISYAFKGLTGGYEASFHRTSYYQKYHEYLIKEQRRIYQYELNLSQDEKEFFIARLFETFQLKFPYYFFTKNCSYYLEEILASTFNIDRASITPYRLPIMTVKTVKGKTKKMRLLPPYFELAKESRNQLKDSEILSLKRINSGERLLKIKDSDQLKNTVYYTYKYKFRKSRNVMPNYLENIRASRVKSSPNPEIKSDNPMSRQNPSTVEFSLVDNLYSEGLNKSFMFRPVNQDIFTNQRDRMHESELILGQTEIVENDGNIKLSQFTIAKMTLHRSFLDPESPLSWFGDLSLNRNEDNQSLAPELSLGFGTGVGNNEFISLMPGIFIRNSESFQVGPLIRVLAGITYKNFKFALDSNAKYLKRNVYFLVESRLGYKIDSHSDIFINLGWNPSIKKTTPGFSARINF